MSVRFLADEDLRGGIVRGLRLREPAIDILDVKSSPLRGNKDPALLELAARQDRILITHDRTTMTRYFYERIQAGQRSPGLFVVPQDPAAVGQVIEALLLVWTCSEPDEWRDQITYLP